jgi:hypothetical protein
VVISTRILKELEGMQGYVYVDVDGVTQVIVPTPHTIISEAPPDEWFCFVVYGTLKGDGFPDWTDIGLSTGLRVRIDPNLCKDLGKLAECLKLAKDHADKLSPDDGCSLFHSGLNILVWKVTLSGDGVEVIMVDDRGRFESFSGNNIIDVDTLP